MDIHEVMQKARGNSPRVHGNGFIQLDLESGARLHVWGHSMVPRQKVDTGIHDHRFAFISRVIVGRVMNVEWNTINYNFAPDNPSITHKIYEPSVREGEDTVLSYTGQVVAAYPSMTRTVLAGQAYTMEPRQFHETISDRPSITIMRKTYEVPSHVARVLVPIGKEPDNEFNRNDFDTKKLWQVIEEVLSC